MPPANEIGADAPPHRHAVVIGCSLAGLFAARVLSDHFERVTVVERDPVNDRPESRKGQPQTRHLHGLLAQGLSIIREMFPGLQETMVAGGAMVADMGEEMRWYQFDGYRVPFKSGLVGMLASRPFLEWHIRRRVLALPNVTLLQSAVTHALALDAGKTRVTGVQTGGPESGSDRRTLAADLVVDAGGRGSQTPSWLASLGYERPREEEIRIGVAYSTRIYRRDPGDLQGASLVMITARPPLGKRMSFLFPIENDRWIAAAGGWAGDHPPADAPGYLEFIGSLPVRDIYDVISRKEPLTDVYTYTFPANLRRHYEELTQFPEGHLVLGDAIASFNPIYGQGMTSAAMQAQALDGTLRRRPSLTGVWRPYFQRVARVVDIPWRMAAGEDFRFPETEGAKPAGTDLINRYVARVHAATHHDPVVYAQFLRVMNLMAPPSSLLHPRIAWRALRRAPRRPAGGPGR
jgi:2-polyprenyl-6-methoxyphenol hydroxylase-like FAD-dependent oxidoreductase